MGATRRAAPALAALAALVALALAWGWRPASERPLGELAEHGVRVTVALERGWLGGQTLVARYAPDEPTGHLYSIDLSPGGVDGVGRPTRLEIPPQPGIRATGPLKADRAPIMQELAGLSAPLAIYPDGPVTLRLPVVAAGGSARLLVSYMACSSTGYCLPPVLDRELRVELP